jgi:hypothetical protein
MIAPAPVATLRPARALTKLRRAPASSRSIDGNVRQSAPQCLAMKRCEPRQLISVEEPLTAAEAVQPRVPAPGQRSAARTAWTS